MGGFHGTGSKFRVYLDSVSRSAASTMTCDSGNITREVLMDHWQRLLHGTLPQDFRSEAVVDVGSSILCPQQQRQAFADAARATDVDVASFLAAPTKVHHATGTTFGSKFMHAANRIAKLRQLENDPIFSTSNLHTSAVVVLWHAPKARCPPCAEMRRVLQYCANNYQHRLQQLSQAQTQKQIHDPRYHAISKRPVLFVEMDAVRNELPDVQIHRLPALQYWPVADDLFTEPQIPSVQDHDFAGESGQNNGTTWMEEAHLQGQWYVTQMRRAGMAAIEFSGDDLNPGKDDTLDFLRTTKLTDK